jgi:hypothetical protein
MRHSSGNWFLPAHQQIAPLSPRGASFRRRGPLEPFPASALDRQGARQAGPGGGDKSKRLLTLWLFYIEYWLTRAGSNDNELALLATRIALAVDGFPWNVDEVPRPRLHDLRAACTRLHPESSREHIDGGLVVPVVMPPGRHSGISSYQPRPQPFGGDRLLAQHPRGVVTFLTSGGGNAANLVLSHSVITPFAPSVTVL